MKRIFSILLVILFLPLCACDGISDILFSGSSGGDAVTIEPFSVEIYNGELSAYNKLDPDQQKVYSIMLYAIENMQLDVIDITDHVSGNGFSDAVIAHRALLCDRPDIFWIPKKYSVLSYEGSNDKHICFKDYFAEDDGIGYYGVTKEQKDQMQSELDAVVNRVLDRKDCSYLGIGFRV